MRVRRLMGRKTVSASEYDADAAVYISSVETADGQSLEPAIQTAINDFVVGCKTDGIWDAIKASCILAGARTLAGALVPLKGPAPTNVDGLFVAGDYNRETGLTGNGSTKYLLSNRNNNEQDQNNAHLAVYSTNITAHIGVLIGGAGNTNETGASNIIINNASLVFRIMNGADTTAIRSASACLLGISRNGASSSTIRANSASASSTRASQTPANFNIGVFATSTGSYKTTSPIAFYSIGDEIDLEKLDTRVTALIAAIGAAI